MLGLTCACEHETFYGVSEIGPCQSFGHFPNTTAPNSVLGLGKNAPGVSVVLDFFTLLVELVIPGAYSLTETETETEGGRERDRETEGER